jgi:hypothetical protein
VRVAAESVPTPGLSGGSECALWERRCLPARGSDRHRAAAGASAAPAPARSASATARLRGRSSPTKVGSFSTGAGGCVSPGLARGSIFNRRKKGSFDRLTATRLVEFEVDECPSSRHCSWAPSCGCGARTRRGCARPRGNEPLRERDQGAVSEAKPLAQHLGSAHDALDPLKVGWCTTVMSVRPVEDRMHVTGRGPSRGMLRFSITPIGPRQRATVTRSRASGGD